MKIDPHVHFRDGKQSYKETITHGIQLAASQGVGMVFDMPNTDPPITSCEDVVNRLALVPTDLKDKYRLYLGLTKKTEQVRQAVDIYNRFREVVGFKLFAGKSVGDLDVTDPLDQKNIYKILTGAGYTGVLAVHCEREDLLKPELWDFHNPASHSAARPKIAEIESVKDQISFAKETGFMGILHICHISCPEAVRLVAEARNEIRITCGVTPHHLLYVKEIQSGSPAGLIYKANPPLRDFGDVESLKYCLMAGEIDWIETDHAPHAVAEKLFHPYLSGFPSLGLYKQIVEEFLPQVGISGELIRKMTSENIIKAFSEKLKLEVKNDKVV